MVDKPQAKPVAAKAKGKSQPKAKAKSQPKEEESLAMGRNKAQAVMDSLKKLAKQGRPYPIQAYKDCTIINTTPIT